MVKCRATRVSFNSFTCQSMASMLVLGSLACFAPAGAAGAQEAEEVPEAGRRLDAVTVTARKREESLQDTPISVSAFTSEDLEVRGFEDIGRLDEATPNVSIDGAARSSGSAANATVFIRGIGLNDYSVYTEPGVGMYIDGVYLGRNVGGLLRISDLERIEVLRGPQGTLFGRNTIGGAVSLITQAPVFETEGRAKITLGENGQQEFAGLFNAPVSDEFAVRFSGDYRKRDGYARSVTTGDELGTIDQYMLRGQALYQPSDRLSLRLSADYSSHDQTIPPTTAVSVTPDNSLLGLFNATVGASAPITGGPVVSDPDLSVQDFVSDDNADIWGVALTADYEVSDTLSLRSITAYRDLEAQYGVDADGTAANASSGAFDVVQDQFSQEFQLIGEAFDGNFEYVAGLYYFEESAREITDTVFAPGLFGFLEGLPGAVFPVVPVPPGTCPPPPGVAAPCAGGPGNPLNVAFDLTFLLDFTTDNQSTAAYAQGSYQLTDRLSVTGGLRFTRDEKSLTKDVSLVASGVPAVDDLTLDTEDEAVSWRIGAEYKAAPETLLYVSAARGFKSGGINGRAFSVQGTTAFAPEFATAYEAGLKSDFFDGRVRANAAAFFTEYEDLQITVASVDPGTGSPIFPVQNAGAAEISGVELELTVLASDNLTLFSTLGLLDTEVTEVAPGSDLVEGARLEKSPETSFSLSADYLVPLNSYDLRFRADYSYTSEQFSDPANIAEVARDDVGLVNGRISFAPKSGRWEAAVFGQNLTDERYAESGFATAFGVNWITISRPRQIGASFTVNF